MGEAPESTAELLEREMQQVLELAKRIDVFGGFGHISGFTDEGQDRRRAANLLRQIPKLVERIRERDSLIDKEARHG